MTTFASAVRKGAKLASGLFDELVLDFFAGGGGASMGIEEALGRAVDYAINHDADALAMHEQNHPGTIHLREDVHAVNPLGLTQGRPVGLAWFSPDCKHFSRAKGAKPVDRKIRSLAWVVVRWAKAVRPRVIILENVREFQDWGPLTDEMRPCQRRKGTTFKRFVYSLRKEGYAVEWKILDAADYGAPTHRRRLFMVARCDGAPIVWPAATHGPGRKRRWRRAADCIDWTLPCASIFGRERELAEKTLRRIAMGLWRYLLNADEPYIAPDGAFVVQCNHGKAEFRGQSLEDPLTTISSKHGYGVVAPTIISGYGERDGQPPRSVDIQAPCPTVVPAPKHALCCAFLSQFFGGMIGKAMTVPVPTITQKGPHEGLVCATMVKFRGDSMGTSPHAPLPTITSGQGAKRPAGAAHALGLSAVCLVRFNHGEKQWHDAAAPLCTITSQTNKNAVVTANLVNFHCGQKQWSAADVPLGTVTAQGGKFGLVFAFLTKAYSSGGQWQSALAPLHTISTKDRFGLVMVEVMPGVREPATAVNIKGRGTFVIADIGLRMLQKKELAKAQGFPASVVLPASGTKAVKMIGNSVSPKVAKALAAANYGPIQRQEAVA